MNDELIKLKEQLSSLLVTLKQNRDNVPLDLLKSKYRKSYYNLLNEIRKATEEYFKYLVFEDNKVSVNDSKEVMDSLLIEINNTGILKELSKAVYIKQNISEVEVLAKQFRDIALEILIPYYKTHAKLCTTLK